MVEINIKYVGGFRCEASHGPSGTRMMTDAPVDNYGNYGQGESFSPTDLVATALGTCMATAMGNAAEKRGISLEGTRVRVKKEMASGDPRKISKVAVNLELPLSPAHPERAALEAAALACPVHKSLHPETHFEVKFCWQDG